MLKTTLAIYTNTAPTQEELSMYLSQLKWAKGDIGSVSVEIMGGEIDHDGLNVHLMHLQADSLEGYGLYAIFPYDSIPELGDDAMPVDPEGAKAFENTCRAAIDFWQCVTGVSADDMYTTPRGDVILPFNIAYVAMGEPAVVYTDPTLN